MNSQISVKRTVSDGRNMKVRSRPNGLTRLNGVNRSMALFHARNKKANNYGFNVFLKYIDKKKHDLTINPSEQCFTPKMTWQLHN